MDNLRLDLIARALEDKGEVVVVVTGDSMKGLIPSSTKVKLIKKTFGQIKVSDIVALRRDSNLIVHQCVFKSKDYLVTWGANNNFLDGKVLPGEILGIVGYPIDTALFQNLLLLEAKVINKNLKRQGANPIWLKGPVYNLYLYGYLLQGRMPDLDVLIDRHKFQEVKVQMEKLGYAMDKKEPSRIKALPYAEISFFKSVGKLTITIDVHLIAVRCSFRKIFPSPIEPDRMMKLNDELIKAPKKYGEFAILNDTSSLAHLCLNIMLHHAGRGVWEHARISRLIDYKQIDWVRFYRILTKHGLTDYPYFPLLWSIHLFGVKATSNDRHIPSRFKRVMVKLIINRLTVCKLIYMDNWFSKKVNTIFSLILRLIISQLDTKHRTVGMNQHTA